MQWVVVVFVTEERQASVRLNDDATVLDAETTATLADLVDASDYGVVPVNHTDYLTTVHNYTKLHQKSDEHHSSAWQHII